jgi:hypothetical protein
VLGGTQWFSKVTEWSHGGSDSVPVATKRCAVVRYVRGTLCSKCCSCYKHVDDGSGKFVPLVIVDPHHSFGTPRDAWEGKRDYKVLNTRITR